MAENHILSLLKSGIKNYNAYVTDKESYDFLTNKGYNVIHYQLEQSTEKMDFGTNNFNEFSYVRYKIINELLNKGKIVWYLDIDTVVFYNLNLLIKKDKTVDVVMQNDINMPCTGCMLFYPTDKSKQLTEEIYNSRNTSANDQIYFRTILNSNNINLILLDHEIFPNGLLYFNELSDVPEYRKLQLDFKNTKKPLCLVHANWMVGVDTKINAFKSKHMWYLPNKSKV